MGAFDREVVRAIVEDDAQQVEAANPDATGDVVGALVPVVVQLLQRERAGGAGGQPEQAHTGLIAGAGGARLLPFPRSAVNVDHDSRDTRPSRSRRIDGASHTSTACKYYPDELVVGGWPTSSASAAPKASTSASVVSNAVMSRTTPVVSSQV